MTTPRPMSDAEGDAWDALTDNANVICTCDGCNYYSPTFNEAKPCELREHIESIVTARERAAAEVGSVYDEIRSERERAHAKHGDKSMESWSPADYARLAILTEEIGEVAREFNEAEIHERDPDMAALRKELIQVAAMAAAWADSIDRQEDRNG